MRATGGPEELRRFAMLLGLRGEWEQRGRHPHFDLRPAAHARALRLGARLVSTRSLARLDPTPLTYVPTTALDI